MAADGAWPGRGTGGGARAGDGTPPTRSTGSGKAVRRRPGSRWQRWSPATSPVRGELAHRTGTGWSGGPVGVMVCKGRCGTPLSVGWRPRRIQLPAHANEAHPLELQGTCPAGPVVRRDFPKVEILGSIPGSGFFCREIGGRRLASRPDRAGAQVVRYLPAAPRRLNGLLADPTLGSSLASGRAPLLLKWLLRLLPLPAQLPRARASCPCLLDLDQLSRPSCPRRRPSSRRLPVRKPTLPILLTRLLRSPSCHGRLAVSLAAARASRRPAPSPWLGPRPASSQQQQLRADLSPSSSPTGTSTRADSARAARAAASLTSTSPRAISLPACSRLRQHSRGRVSPG